VAELWLVCEGESESIDVSILKPILTTVLASDIVVEPSFGSSPAVVARFIETQRGGRSAYITDRDYESRDRAEASFIDGKPGFIWRRHSIENYLLQPLVIVGAFRRLRERFERQQRGHLPAWVISLPTDPDQVTDALRECGRRRAAEEACRFTIHRLWEDISESAGRVQKRTPAAPRGRDPIDPNVWREALDEEATRLREAGRRTEAELHLEAIAVAARYDKHYSNLSAAEYLRDLQFLIDFHGRDLLKEFRVWLETLGIHFPYESLIKELAAAMVEAYAGNRAIHGTDDFLQLANGVRALAGLGSV
jgi:hypothetical protein